MRSTKIIKICSSSLCTCLHHMVILRTRNKITDFLMILAWASPFKLKLQGNCYNYSNVEVFSLKHTFFTIFANSPLKVKKSNIELLLPYTYKGTNWWTELGIDSCITYVERSRSHDVYICLSETCLLKPFRRHSRSFEIPLTWSCILLPRPTTSSGWKISLFQLSILQT